MKKLLTKCPFCGSSLYCDNVCYRRLTRVMKDNGELSYTTVKRKPQIAKGIKLYCPKCNFTVTSDSENEISNSDISIAKEKDKFYYKLLQIQKEGHLPLFCSATIVTND